MGRWFETRSEHDLIYWGDEGWYCIARTGGNGEWQHRRVATSAESETERGHCELSEADAKRFLKKRGFKMPPPLDGKRKMDRNDATKLVIEKCGSAFGSGPLYPEFQLALNIAFKTIGEDCDCGCGDKISMTDAVVGPGMGKFRGCLDVKRWFKELGWTDGHSDQTLVLDATIEFMINEIRTRQRFWTNGKGQMKGGWCYIIWDGTKLHLREAANPGKTWPCSYSIKTVINNTKFVERANETAAFDWCKIKNNEDAAVIGKPRLKETDMADLEGAKELRAAVRDSADMLGNARRHAEGQTYAMQQQSELIGNKISNARKSMPSIIRFATAPVAPKIGRTTVTSTESV